MKHHKIFILLTIVLFIILCCEKSEEEISDKPWKDIKTSVASGTGQLYVLDDSDERYNIKKSYGPYASE